jgi:O-6-methylguanine DNA methyltransferase
VPSRPTIATAVVAAPWGPIHVAASEHGLVAIEHLVSDEEFEAGLQRRFGRRPALRPAERAPGRTVAAMLRRAVAAATAFVEGDLDAFAGLPLDLSDRSHWDRRVLEAVREIPPGATASYGDVARMIGSPGAARAVGGAVGRCPIGLAVPCHRVIAGDGTVGGYGGGSWGGRAAGIALKEELLAREGIHLPRRRGAG